MAPQARRLVVVTWLDIVGHERPWYEPEEAQGLRPAEITSLGILIDEKEDYIIVAGSWEDDGCLLGNVSCIPRGVVRELRSLGNTASLAETANPD